MEDSKIKWAVGLSNGTNAYEGKNEYQIIKGQDSPWQRLLKNLNEVKITSLSLYSDKRRWNLPSAGNNPKFKAFDDAPKPLDYRFFRKAGIDILSGKQETEIFAVAEAIYENYKLQIWVSEDNPDNCWSLII